MIPVPDSRTRQKVVRARTDLVLGHPFFGHLALQMALKEDASCETAWSDGKTIGYNPLYARILPREKLTGLLGHVVMHPACRHHLRRKNRHPGIWNKACDYAINWILLDAGLTLPDGFLDDPKYRGKTADEIYARLSEADFGRPPDARNPKNKEKDGRGREMNPPEAQNRPDKKGGQQDTEDEKASSAPSGETPDPPAENRRESSADPGRSGEVRDAPNDDAGGLGDQTAEESQWRINLAQAASRARSMGRLPAGLARMVENLLSPRLDWRQLLSRFIQASARYDYAWTPPNRRYLHQGLYLPSMRSTDLPEAVVAVDTSGSISARELDRFAAETSAILGTCAQTVHLLYCDAKVARAQTVLRHDLPLSLVCPGGGGTDFRPAFDWVDEQGIHPFCMIYLTDLACTRFPPPPSYPVLWACPDPLADSPPFGECIFLT